MPRQKDRNTRTPTEIIQDVLKWAERQSFENIAADLRNALQLLREENTSDQKTERPKTTSRQIH